MYLVQKKTSAMITVIIPALNEEEHIASVIDFAKSYKYVSEVIVVDDQSSDNTVFIAKNRGAKVITSATPGKGSSMKDGIRHAGNDIIVFLDGDIEPYPTGTIKLLTTPIRRNKADFVKSSFDRNAGRVTELVAKPLLSILFPELTRFQQPLSGMIAGRKSLFEKITFNDDYGVDIGILIDMYLMNVRIKEVNIGYLENKSKPWQALGKMSKEVASAIISKAASSNNPNLTFEELGSIAEIRSQLDINLSNELKSLHKLMIFDMDNTLLQGRFVDVCAARFGFEEALMNIRHSETDPMIITKRIATLFKGKSHQELIAVADNIPIVGDAASTIKKLKDKGYIIGIISDSYHFVTEHLKSKLGVDFSMANELEFSKNTCTGEVKIPSFFINSEKSICKHSICKTNALLHILDNYQINIKNTIAIGDSRNDLCMIKNAGVGVAFCSNDNLLKYYADVIINEPRFRKLLKVIG